MTQPQTLNVEYDELMARADELEAPVPGQPSDNPQAPCALALATAAAAQLALSADNMRLYLGVGIDREWRRLAESLRNAAKVYEEVDEDAAEGIQGGNSVAPSTFGFADEDLDPAMLAETPTLKAATDVPYYPVRDAAEQIAQLDQGAAFDSFAAAWTTYQQTLLEARYRFRPFQYWWSTASEAVEANFDSERSWLDSMSTMCATMASQARGVTSAHRWAVKEHPTVAQLKELDDAWVMFQTQWPWNMSWSSLKPQLEAEYAKLQTKSEEVLAEYEKRAALPLPPLSPPKPPSAYRIDPPAEPEPVQDPGTGMTVPDGSYEEELSLAENLPDPTGMPGVGSVGAAAMSSMPTDSTLSDATLTEALTTAIAGAAGLSSRAGVKPASFGGGGVGMPSMPLQPPVEAESASRPAATAPGVPGLGRGVPGPGGAAGGGMGGMAPMAPGQRQDAGKQGKRVDTDDESLYIEQRKWTEGVVGVLRPSA